jgi:predicted lactoylglutathione lyase
MKTRVDCISLPVESLAATVAFYRDGLGWAIGDVDEKADHIPLQLPSGSYLVFIERSDYSAFTDMAALTVAPKGASGCILSYFADSKAEVDEIMRQAAASGARTVEAAERPWGYAGLFTDPDQHLWEVLWNANLTQPKDTP